MSILAYGALSTSTPLVGREDVLRENPANEHHQQILHGGENGWDLDEVTAAKRREERGRKGRIDRFSREERRIRPSAREG